MLFFAIVPLRPVDAQEAKVTDETLSTTTPLSRMEQEWWKNRHELRLEQKAKLDQLDLLLVGDSITQGWESTGKPVFEATFGDLKTFNLGFSGDRTEHVIWRLQNDEVDGLKPAVTMVLIGTNNTGQKMDKPEDIAAGVKAIIDELTTRLPETKVLLLAAFPYDKDPESPRRKNNNQLNEIIKGFHDGQAVHYLDINESLFDDSGNMTADITPDFLHLSKAGYQIWGDAVNDKIRELGKQ